jgi:predicted metalloprotease
MTFNENANVGGNTARRRGAGVAVAGGGVVGLGAIAVLLLQLFTGQDFSSVLPLGPGTDASGGGDTEIAQCETGADANANDSCRLAAGSVVLDKYWQDEVQGYRAPTLVIVNGSASSSCGTASNQTGPFYCPPDESVYVDPTFFGLMRDQFGASAGDLAQLYVLAHEYGHHVQYITGIMDQHPNDGAGATGNGVRTELQADCFAGAWVGAMTQEVDENGVPYLQPPTQAQIADALNAAAAVGDDNIQERSSGFSNPETWTHGSSEQRQRWFQLGYQGGVPACDTFGVPGGSL